MIPTVLAFIPLSNAYTIAGNFSGIFCTPRDSAYMPIAPGKLQMRKAKKAGMSPAWIKAMQKSIFVLAGPGSAWHIAKSSWYY
jgi:hypothetical protein